MTTPLRLSMIISGDASNLKTATSSAKADIAGVSDSAAKSSTATDAMAASNDKAASALNREAEAARKATEEAKKLAAARSQVSKFEYETRDQVEKRLGLKPNQSPTVQTPQGSIGTASVVAGSQTAAEAGLRDKIGNYLGIGSKSSDPSMAQRAKELASYTQELDRTRAQYKPLIDAQQRHLTLLNEINVAAKIGAISEDQRVAAAGQAQAAYSAQVATIQNGGAVTAKATALASHEVTNLSYQLNDIVVMLASGQSPFLMMMQQGGQVAQIMGNRGLGSILPALGQGIRMLVTPTTMVMVGMTALGYAASYIFDGMFTKTRKLSEVISEHEQNIRKLREAYQYAGTGADDYYRRASGGSRIASAGTRIELEKAAKRNVQSVLSDVSVQTYGTGIFIVDPAYKHFSDAIEYLRKTAKDGKPDLLGFRQLVEDRWNLEPNNQSLMKTGLSLLKLSKDGLEAAETLEKLDPAVIRFDNALEANKRRIDAYAEALSGLRGMRTPELSDRRRVETDYAAANGNATDRTARDQAYQQRENALTRIAELERRQNELTRIDIQLQGARDPWTRAELAAKRERIQLSGMEIDAIEAETRVRQARDQVMNEAMAQSTAQIIDLRAEAEARAKVNDALAAGTIKAADAEQYLRIESELRPLIAAAAKAEGDEKQRLLAIISQMIVGYQALAEQDKRTNALDFIRSQNEKIASLKVEMAVVGETAIVRRSLMSQLEAEQEIRRSGISLGSAEATQIRANAAQNEKLTQQLEKQADAWRTVRQAGENAIDGLVDKISSGDFSGALEDFAKDISKSFLTLGVTNPLKNNLLGTNLGTMSDVGGLRGIASKLFGGGEVDASGIIQSALGGQSVGTMSVTAASVMINGGAGFGDNIIKMLSGANDNSLLGGSDNKSMANFATAIKNIESSGNYSALGPVLKSGDRAYGAYQVMGGNIPSWTKSALGTSLNPQQFLASNEAQDAVFNKIFGGYANKFGATGAAQAWFGGPGSVGKGNVSDILGTTGSGYAEKFNAQLQLLSGTTSTANTTISDFGLGLNNASGSLDQFGSGLGKLAQSLMTSLFPGAGGFQSNQLVNAIASGIGGLWSSGGYTGPGAVDEPRGVVHAGEVVWSQRDVARAGGVGTVEAMRLGRRGYMDGGTVAQSGASSLAKYDRTGANNNGMVDTRPVIQVINNSSAQVNAEVEETTNNRGQRQYKLVMADVVSEGIATPGRGQKTFEQLYGARRAPRRRT